MSIKRIKTITSYTGLARWLSEVDEKPVGYLARVQVEDISSPYAYSPSKPIFNWDGRSIVYFETSHKRYEVFQVPSDLLRFKTDEEATDWHIKYSRKVV